MVSVIILTREQNQPWLWVRLHALESECRVYEYPSADSRRHLHWWRTNRWFQRQDWFREDRENLNHARTMMFFIENLRETSRSEVTDNYSEYSDTMRLFVFNFTLTYFVSRDSQRAFDQYCALEYVSNLVARSNLNYSSLKSVSSLIE